MRDLCLCWFRLAYIYVIDTFPLPTREKTVQAPRLAAHDGEMLQALASDR